MSKGTRTPGQIEIVGASHLAIFGEHGANICTVTSPRQSASAEYTKLELGDPDFHEACANAAFLRTAWNCHDELLAACEQALANLKDRGAEDGETGDQLRDAIAKAKGTNGCNAQPTT